LLFNAASPDSAVVLAEQAITIDDVPPAPQPLLIDICTPN
jgi:hypothetical protein